MKNIFEEIPENTADEQLLDLLKGEHVRVERIVSLGQCSPENFWYDQKESEWVLLLKGAAVVEFADGTKHALKPGDYLNIPAHQKHRVAWTDPHQPTLWLAVFYS